MSRDPRITELRELLRSGLSGGESAPGDGDELDEVLALAREHLALVDARAQARLATNQRIEALLEVVVALVAFDYERKATIGDDNDMFDAMAAGLNMLGEELAASTVSRAYVDNILESMADAVLVVDLTGAVTMVNHAATQLLDARREDLLRRPLADLLPGLDAGPLIEAGGIRDIDLVLTGKDGAEIVASLSVSVMRDRGVISGLVCVLRDVSESRRLVAERARMHEAFARQAVLIEQLSTPLIPITDQILVMPLIGPLDAERGTQMTEVLLEGIAARRTRVAILDITGVRAVGHDAILGIMRASRAAALVGASVLLTGIGPEVARSITALGIDTHHAKLVTFGTLQAGIVHAVKLVAQTRRA